MSSRSRSVSTPRRDESHSVRESPIVVGSARSRAFAIAGSLLRAAIGYAAIAAR